MRGSRAAEAALTRLDELAGRDWLIAEHLDHMRSHYGRRMDRHAKDGNAETVCSPAEAAAFRRLRHETLTAERLAVIRLRNEGTIGDELLHRLEQELDVEALRHGLGEQRVSMTDQQIARILHERLL